MKKRITLLFTLSFFLAHLSNAQVNFIRQQNVPVQIGAGNVTLPWAGGINYPVFSEMDFNLDGIMDLLCMDRVHNRIVPFVNGGTANQVDYTYAPEYVKFLPPPNMWVLTYDYDCDGRNDFFTLSDDFTGIKIYRNISPVSGPLQFTMAVYKLMSLYPPPTNYSNISASYGLMPAFSDIDNDGDMDVLAWRGSTAGMVEYNKNLSVENGYGCDSLQFDYITSCYGNFSLMLNINKAALGISCRVGFSLPPSPSLPPVEPLKYYEYYDPSDAARDDDTMSSICIIDIDGDSDKDLLVGGLGDINSLELTNGGTIAAANMTSQDTLFPSYDNPAQVNSFTTHAYLDVDNDGKKDLLVSPTFSEDFAGIWFYKNTGSTAVPVFDYEVNNFLQRDIIETGSGAYPAFFDYDADGLLDFVIGNYSYYQPAGGFKSGLSLYRNIGTTTAPAFQLMTRDYSSLFQYDFTMGAYGNDVHPTFGDIDGDGDKDMLLGDYNGKIQAFTNTAGAGNPAVFSFTGPNYQGIDIGNNAAPQLVDLNHDNLLDLVIGGKNGVISYYQNTGTVSVPAFTLVNDTLGNVNVSYLTNGYASPFVFDDSGTYKMLVANDQGHVFLYGNIDGNLNGTFTLLDTVLSRTEGNKINVGMGDINGDTLMDLLVGSYSGGVALFYRDNPLATNSPIVSAKPSFEVFPNPASENAVIQFSNLNPSLRTFLSIYNMAGEKIYHAECKGLSQTLNISSYSSGLYLLRLEDGNNSLVRKLLVH